MVNELWREISTEIDKVEMALIGNFRSDELQ